MPFSSINCLKWLKTDLYEPSHNILLAAHTSFVIFSLPSVLAQGHYPSVWPQALIGGLLLLPHKHSHTHRISGLKQTSSCIWLINPNVFWDDQVLPILQLKKGVILSSQLLCIWTASLAADLPLFATWAYSAALFLEKAASQSKWSFVGICSIVSTTS